MTKRTYFVLVIVLFSILILTACDNSDDETDNTSEEDTGQKTVALVADVPADTPVELIRGIVEDPISPVLAERGYVNGENLIFKTYLIGEQSDESLDFSGSDVIIALAEGALQRLVDARIEQPIVFMGESAIVDQIRDQLDVEGRSVTGVLTPTADAKRFELLLEMAPDIDTLFVPYDPELEESRVMFETVERMAQESDIDLIAYEYTDLETVRTGFEEMPEDVDAIFVSSDETMSVFIDELALLSIRRKVPLSYDNLALAVPEVFMSYGTNLQDSINSTGRLVAQILDGVDAKDLPFETIDPRLMISLGAAEAIGLDIPDSVLQQASVILRDKVIVPDITPVAGFCSSTMESVVGTFAACVTISCNSIENTQLASFTDREDVDGCTTEGLLGICSSEESDLYIYDGDLDLITSGCGLNGGTWIDPAE